MSDKTWDEWIIALRNKWHNVPGGTVDIISTSNFNPAPEEMEKIAQDWISRRNSSVEGEYYNVRGWYHEKYKPIFQGRKVMDLGCGLGMDGITFAQNGANVTFVDIVESNLIRIKKLCDHFNISNVSFMYLENLKSFEKLDKDFDFIYAQGSMINAPFEIMRQECSVVLEHLKVGGRWIELAYPKERWENDGKMSFERWGDVTDHGAPWMEWYDLDKILNRLNAAHFEVVDTRHFGISHHGNEFNWFDLRKK
jgi:SAM-dependent methyltransferase